MKDAYVEPMRRMDVMDGSSNAASVKVWGLLPHGQFRIRVLAALIRHHWFVRLRWIFAFLALLLLLIDRAWGTTRARPPALWLTIAALALVNVLWTVIGYRYREALQQSDNNSHKSLRRMTWFVNAQMSIDILILTSMLRYSGGIENPMAIFYLFHMLIAALLLKPLNALLQGGWALLLFCGLALGECFGLITPHYAFLPWSGTSHAHTDPFYVVTCLGVLAAGVIGTLYFTLQISSGLDEQEVELFETNAALRTSKDAVERLQERRSRFLRTAAHQLKSPLTGIEMLAGLIRDGVVDGNGIQNTISRIMGRCRKAIGQVGELLALERIEGASPDRHTASGTLVAAALDRLAGIHRPQAQSKNVNLSLHVDCNASTRAAVDPRDFDDCIGNVLDNAVKYTSQGGIISVTAHEECDGVRISVRDDGMGIAKSSLETVFEPFHRGNEALAAGIPGSGLGLAIVREVVEQANGEIRMESEEGRGTTFQIWFPSMVRAAPTRPVRRPQAVTDRMVEAQSPTSSG